MDRDQKFEMLSVVAYGIHTRMRERLYAVFDDASQDRDLRRVLGPVYYFYEYFLDSPALLSEVAPAPTACAPFLRRLVLDARALGDGARERALGDHVDPPGIDVGMRLREAPVLRERRGGDRAGRRVLEEQVAWRREGGGELVVGAQAGGHGGEDSDRARC